MLGLQAPNAVIDAKPDLQLISGAPGRSFSRATETLVFWVKFMRIAVFILSAYWLLIFVGTHLPAPALPALGTSDKLLHLAAFAGLAFLLAWAIPSGRWPLSRNLALAAAIAFGYAVLDELSQQFIPGRTCDPLDVAADTVGILIGLASYLAARGCIIRIGWARRLLLRNG